MAAHTRDHALAVGSIGRLSHLSAHAAESCGASRSSRVKGPNPNPCRVSQLRSSVSVVIADSMLHQPCSSLGHPGWPLGSGSDKHLIHFRVPRNTRFLEHSSCTRHHSLMHHHPMHRRLVQHYERLKHHLSSALCSSAPCSSAPNSCVEPRRSWSRGACNTGNQLSSDPVMKII